MQRSDGSALLMGLQREVDPTRPLLGKATPCIGREQDLLGRPLGLGGVTHIRDVARRITALLLMGPELDMAYEESQ